MFIRVFSFLVFCIPATALAQIEAVFDTSLGTFTAALEFEKTPQTVANFVSLAEGSRTWIEEATGLVRKQPYYDGITFHRVAPGFVIQGGSPNGNGTDGPGYSFQDEFDASLRHDAPYILSMANSGVNSNGSQFFITLAPTPFLNDIHSIFGRVTSGSAVVDAIGNVPTQNERPDTPVVIHSVTIIRTGAAAEAFDVTAHGLPTAAPAEQTSLTQSGNTFSLGFTQHLFSEYYRSDSPDLTTWSSPTTSLLLSPPTQTPVDVSAIAAGNDRHFFQVAEVRYPAPLFTAPSLDDATITIDFLGLSMDIALNGDGTAIWTIASANASSTITSWSYSPFPYRGILGMNFNSSLTLTRSEGGNTIQLNLLTFSPNLVFTSATGGTYRGDIRLFNQSSGLVETQRETGNFTLQQ